MGARDLQFDEQTHTYTVGGVRVPSVTEVLKPLQCFDGIAEEVLERKRDLGSRVHAATQFLDEDDLDESSIEPDVAPYLRAYTRFLAGTGARVVLNEQRVYSALGYAGTLDRLVEIKREQWLIDYKTCLSVPLSVGPQTAAYLRALLAERPDLLHTKRAALLLRRDGTFRFKPLTGSDDWSAFMACLALHNFRARNQ